MKKTNKITKEGRRLTSILKGAIAALIIATILLIAVSIFYNNTDLSTTIIQVILCIILAISSFFGGWISSKYYKKSGMQNGAICGIILFCAITFIGCIIHGFAFTPFTLFKAGAIIVFGAFGGIIGINRSAKHKMKL